MLLLVAVVLVSLASAAAPHSKRTARETATAAARAFIAEKTPAVPAKNYTAAVLSQFSATANGMADGSSLKARATTALAALRAHASGNTAAFEATAKKVITGRAQGAGGEGGLGAARGGGGDTGSKALELLKTPGGRAQMHAAIMAKVGAMHAKKLKTAATKKATKNGGDKHVTLDKKMKVATAAHKKVKPVARS